MRAPSKPVRPRIRSTRLRQRGWAGVLVILVALVIVGFLAKDSLKAYLGVGPKPTTAQKAGTPGERVRAPGAIGSEAFDPTSAPPSGGSALERARGVEDMVKQQAAEREARGDGVTR